MREPTGTTELATASDPAAAARPQRRRRRHLAPFIAVAIAAVLAVFVVVLANGTPAVDRVTVSPLLGKPAPAIDATTVDGLPFKLADHKGTWVVVNFFAPWCSGCRQEHPDLISFSQRHRAARDAELVAVIFDDTTSHVKTFRDSQGGDWPMVVDPSGAVAVDYGVSALPETFVIDPNGFVQAHFASPVSADGLDRIITTLSTGVPASSP